MRSTPRPTRTERQRFAIALSELRDRAGLPQSQVVDALKDLGHPVRQQSYSGWEAGKYAPDVDKARALDDVLDGDGLLLDALGYPNGDSGVIRYDLNRDLREQVNAWTIQLADVLSQLAEERAERERLNDELAKERSLRERLQGRVQELERRAGVPMGPPKPKGPRIPPRAVPSKRDRTNAGKGR